MLRHLFLSLMALLSTAAQAQLAEWILKPEYDEVELVPQSEMLRTTANRVTTFLSLDGRQILATPNRVAPYREGFAVSMKPREDVLVGFYNLRGERVGFADECFIPHHYPYFSDGHLLICMDGKYLFMDANRYIYGEEQLLRDARPLRHGLAPCFKYRHDKPRKGGHWIYMDANHNYVQMQYPAGKDVNPLEVTFASSVCDEGYALVVMADKLYRIYPGDPVLRPACLLDADTAPAHQLTGVKVLNGQRDSMLVTALGPDRQSVTITFDPLLLPHHAVMADSVYVYHRQTPQVVTYDSQLHAYIPQGQQHYALQYMGQDVMPAQFDSVKAVYGDRAIVHIPGGQWGVLQLHPNDHFQYRINDGRNIGFRHQHHKAKFLLEMPAYVSAEATRIVMPEGSPCQIDLQTRQQQSNDEGNVLTYDCQLTIPMAISPDSLLPQSYGFAVQYDHLTTYDLSVNTMCWYNRYFSVNMDDASSVITADTVSFVFQIDPGDVAVEDMNYMDVKVQAQCRDQVVKLSPTRYLVKLYGLSVGLNNVSVQLTDVGCPPTYFPFEFTYRKPQPRPQGAKPDQQRVAIQQKKEKPVTRPEHALTRFDD